MDCFSGSAIIFAIRKYGKLVAYGQTDGNYNLSLPIFPFGKRERKVAYMKDWFSIDNYKTIELKKGKWVRFFEAVFTIFIFILLYNLINLFCNKYQFVILIIMIFACVHLVIRILFSYISMGDEITAIHKAGITSRISYIRSSDIFSLEVESNFLQRKFDYVNLYIHYVSCNDERSIKLNYIKKKEANSLTGIWR